MLNRRRKIYTFNIFERIRRVPRQSGGIYCENVARIKTANRQRDIVIRRLINRDLKNDKSIKSKEIMKLHTGHIFIK